MYNISAVHRPSTSDFYSENRNIAKLATFSECNSRSHTHSRKSVGWSVSPRTRPLHDLMTVTIAAVRLWILASSPLACRASRVVATLLFSEWSRPRLASAPRLASLTFGPSALQRAQDRAIGIL